MQYASQANEQDSKKKKEKKNMKSAASDKDEIQYENVSTSLWIFLKQHSL